jgi:hypothetical protein
MLPKISIKDSNFDHRKPERRGSDFEWDWVGRGYFTVYTDLHLNPSILNEGGRKVAWLVEPPVVSSEAYNFVSRNYQEFNKILTFDKRLIDTFPNAVFYPLGGSWVNPEDRGIPKKNKLVSMISSMKNVTSGQKLRIEAINKLKNVSDLYGRGHRTIQNKAEGLVDYGFSVTIENSRLDNYFTEKIIDCFLTGTIPIYWGCPSIGEFFDAKGIIVFNTIEELESIVNNISFEDYEKRRGAVEANYKKAKYYQSIENNLWNHFFGDYIKKEYAWEKKT